MTLEDFKDVYKDETPIEKLRLMQVQHGYWRNDMKDRIDANWRGNYDEEARYYVGECDAMADRVAWLHEEIEKALATHAPHVLTLEEMLGFDGAFLIEYNSEIISRDANWAMLHFMDAKWVHVWRPRLIEHFARDQYGKTWRCWTSRPDDKRRAETPWD